MNLLAFDLGGSSGKLFLAEYSHGQISYQEIHRFENSPCPINGGLYWDIIYLYRQMNEGIQKAIRLTGDQIDSFGIDSFCNDFGFIDKNGELITPVRCYRDNRTERYQSEIYKVMTKKQLYARNGNQISPVNTLMQLAAMKASGQDSLFGYGHKMLFIPDLFHFFLTGCANSEFTISSVSQMYHYSKEDWDDEILSEYDFPREMFCPLIEPGAKIGNTQPSYNAQMKTKGFPTFAVCEHDTASAFIASSCREDCVIISSGTWSLIGTEVKQPIISEETYRYNFANEGGYKDRNRLLRCIMGLWYIEEIKRYFETQGQAYGFDELDQLAKSAPAFRYLIDVDDASFFQPGDIPEKLAAFCMERYQSKPETIGEYVRCIYESLAMKYRWIIEKLEKVVHKPLPVINIVGGGSKAEILCQFTADVCNKPVLAGPANASAIGNLSVQLVAVQAAATIEQAKELMLHTYNIKTYLPKNTERWELAYQEYLQNNFLE